jgi:hypothetical protein
MNAARLREQVRGRLSNGTLTRASVTAVVAGYGKATDICAACQSLIRHSEVEYKLNFGTAADSVHMHYYCFVIWERERVADESPAEGETIPFHRELSADELKPAR